MISLFFESLLLVFVLLPLEFIDRLPSKLMGFGNPQYESLAHLKHNWKALRGIESVDAPTEIVCVNGYLYIQVTYTDDTKLMFRGD